MPAARALPNVRHQMLPAAHMMSLEQPAAFKALALAFLAGVEV